MRAAILERNDHPLRLATVPRPVAGPGQVLVRIKASGTNPLDLKIAEGAAAHARHPAPSILGLDMAGVVESIGPEVTGFATADPVYGMVGGVGGIQGTLAEFAAVDADLVAPKPANLSYREAAVLPLVAITAWEGMVDRMKVGPGESLLVLGGSGGVGRLAIQLGLAFGAEVHATASAGDRTLVEHFGATFIDRNEPVAGYVNRLTGGRGFDRVYDTVGGPVLDDAFMAVAKFGHVASALGWGTHALAPLSFKAATYSGVFTLMPLLTGEGRSHHGEILRAVTRLVEAGRLRPGLDPQLFTLSTVNEAHQTLARRHTQGKIAIEID
jgi:NADPH:quinone reductase-like Zn-dependent oxidoreductase